ncbi:MAG: SixA phosphatase family protein [Cytophagaceae bacterium]
MGKLLYLVRHAKSDWSVPGQKDFDRELNHRGNADAPKMGRKLYDLGVRPDLILSSPAVRAKMTAHYMAEQLRYETENIVLEEELYEPSVRSFLNVINRQNDKFKSLMLFSHNPAITYLAEYLTKAPIGNIPTSGVAEVEFDIDTWAEVSGDVGKLNWFIYPKKI